LKRNNASKLQHWGGPEGALFAVPGSCISCLEEPFL